MEIRVVKFTWLSLPPVTLQPLTAEPGSSGTYLLNWCHDTLRLCLYSNELFSTVYFASLFHKSSSTLVIMQNSDRFPCAGVSLGGSSWAFQPVPSSLQGP